MLLVYQLRRRAIEMTAFVDRCSGNMFDIPTASISINQQETIVASSASQRARDILCAFGRLRLDG